MVSEIYYKYFDIFNKIESDKLFLYRFKMNHIIEIKGNTDNLNYNLLYKMLINELKFYNKYLIDNLRKGFIKSSFALWAVLIFFVYKQNNKLRIYINDC